MFGVLLHIFDKQQLSEKAYAQDIKPVNPSESPRDLESDQFCNWFMGGVKWTDLDGEKFFVFLFSYQRGLI